MNECHENFGDQYLQRAQLFSPWYLSFRSMSIRAKKLQQNKGKLGIFKSAATRKITIHPNESVQVTGYVDRELEHPDTTAMLQETDESVLSPWIDIEPTVIQ